MRSPAEFTANEQLLGLREPPRQPPSAQAQAMARRSAQSVVADAASVRPLNVLAVSGDMASPIAEIRLGIPMRALTLQRGWFVRLKSSRDCTRPDWRWADVVVMQRACAAKDMHRMRWLKARGIPVIYEIDDLLYEPAEHLAHADYMRRDAWRVKQMLSMADAITASTPALAQQLSGFGRPITVVPNYPPDTGVVQAVHEDVNPVTVLIAASDHQQLAPLASALQRLQSDLPRLQVLAIGLIADSLHALGVSCRTLPVMSREAFLATVATLPNPIGAIPLDDSPFSNCKSAIKVFDYSAVNIPCVCSDVTPYREVIAHNVSGMLCGDSADAWYAAIRTLAMSAQRRNELSKRARTVIYGEFGLQRTVAVMADALKAVCARQPRRSARSDALACLARASGDWMERLVFWVRELNRQRVQVRRKAQLP